jgi:cell division protein FtsW (lipid II flippase)
MKLSKTWVVALFGLLLIVIQPLQVGVNGAGGWIAISFNEAEASEDRRVARRTSRRTASRQKCGSSWC